MLSFADQLKDKVAVLLEDVGALHLVAGIGFSADEDELFASNRRHLARGPWRYVELASEDAAARANLQEAWDSERLVLLLPERPPRPLIELVRAHVDGREHVDLGDFNKRKRRSDQSLVLLVNGAPTPDRIPPDFRKVVCWEFV